MLAGTDLIKAGKAASATTRRGCDSIRTGRRVFQAVYEF